MPPANGAGTGAGAGSSSVGTAGASSARSGAARGMKRPADTPLAGTMQEMKIIPLGAGAEVGRSCHILKYKGKTIMVCCCAVAAVAAVAAACPTPSMRGLTTPPMSIAVRLWHPPGLLRREREALPGLCRGRAKRDRHPIRQVGAASQSARLARVAHKGSPSTVTSTSTMLHRCHI